MKELDVIELQSSIGSWKAGTKGTVLELWDGSALVEIANGDGETLELLTVPVDAAKVVWSVDAQERPEVSRNVAATANSSRRASR